MRGKRRKEKSKRGGCVRNIVSDISVLKWEEQLPKPQFKETGAKGKKKKKTEKEINHSTRGIVSEQKRGE